MTDVELSALEAAAKAATPGPWGTAALPCQEKKILLRADGCTIGRTWPKHSVFAVDEECERNAAFIAAANPAAILELIAELRQTKAERDWLVSRFLKGGRCPSKEAWRKCDLDDGVDCKNCWLDAAKEATCQK